MSVPVARSRTARDICRFPLHKAWRPIRRATRGSGLERHLEEAMKHAWSLPPGFTESSHVELSSAGDLMNQAVIGPGERPFDFVATACNHSLDFGEEGVSSTLHALRERGIAFHQGRTAEGKVSTFVSAGGVREVEQVSDEAEGRISLRILPSEASGVVAR